jgi:hypothetical protein
MLTANALKGKGFGADHLFEVLEDGGVIATLNETRFTFEHGGANYAVHREGVFAVEYTLRYGEAGLVKAAQTPLVNTYTILLDGTEWVLKAEDLLASKFGFYQGERKVGGVLAGGYFSRFKGIAAEFPAEIPMPVQLFLLLLVIWKWAGTGS